VQFNVHGMAISLPNDFIARLDRCEDMSVHVSTCITHDFKALMSVAWKLWR